MYIRNKPKLLPIKSIVLDFAEINNTVQPERRLIHFQNI